jgi:O-methyltransferase involved in polyketide biosynthesis
MAQVRVRLSEAQETLLVTLCGRAWDARARQPILGDTMAAAAVEQMDYDFRRAKVNPRVAASVAVRAKQFDDWTAEFLAKHDQAIVVHLAAGLDTRVWRVNPEPGVTWYDVDYPEVIALRSRLYPERGHYHMIGSSVTAPSWLAQVPAGRPTLIVAEGLTMYLKPEEGHELMRRLTGHFVHGIIVFDAFNRLTIRVQHLNPAVRGCGARMYWGIDDPAELERASPRLHCLEAAKALYTPGAAALPLSTRITAKLFRPFPPLRDMCLYLRYEF